MDYVLRDFIAKFIILSSILPLMFPPPFAHFELHESTMYSQSFEAVIDIVTEHVGISCFEFPFDIPVFSKFLFCNPSKIKLVI